MPPDLLMPALALLLLANAVLVIAAIRGLRDGRFEPQGFERGSSWPEVRGDAARARRDDGADGAAGPSAVADARGDGSPGPAPVGLTTAVPPDGTPSRSSGEDGRDAGSQAEHAVDLPDRRPRVASSTARRPRAKTGAAATASGEGPSAAVTGDRPAASGRKSGTTERASGPSPAPRDRPPTRATTPTGTSPTRATTSTGKPRRKFSLPPLDADEEKVTRSIESFLAGGDPSGDPASEDGSPPDTAARDAGAGDGRDDPSATTVAIVAVGFAGIGPKRRRGASTREAVALVERTLRATARRRDEVQAAGPGRFRIVLAATGELAARAYLRRIRTIVEPLLALEPQPAVLHIAIATVLDEPLETAIAVAEQRLAAAISTAEADAAAQVGAMDADSFPQDPRRAAGD